MNNDPETEELLHTVLCEALRDRPDLVERLIGTAVIEGEYFEELT